MPFMYIYGKALALPLLCFFMFYIWCFWWTDRRASSKVFSHCKLRYYQKKLCMMCRVRHHNKKFFFDFTAPWTCSEVQTSYAGRREYKLVLENTQKASIQYSENTHAFIFYCIPQENEVERKRLVAKDDYVVELEPKVYLLFSLFHRQASCMYVSERRETRKTRQSPSNIQQ